MMVDINYRTNSPNGKGKDKVFFVDEKFNISQIKNNFLDGQYSYIFDLIKIWDKQKKILKFEFNLTNLYNHDNNYLLLIFLIYYFKLYLFTIIELNFLNNLFLAMIVLVILYKYLKSSFRNIFNQINLNIFQVKI